MTLQLDSLSIERGYSTFFTNHNNCTGYNYHSDPLYAMYGSAAFLKPPALSSLSASSFPHSVGTGASEGYRARSKSRIASKSFKYNGRVAAVLLSSLLVLVGYGGPMVAGVLIVSSLLCMSMSIFIESERNCDLTMIPSCIMYRVGRWWHI